MDERLRQSLLYDFYGELLNDHQKTVFSAAIFDDMSYSELAEEFDCSRQAAFDLIRRINNKLEDYESRLGMLSRFTSARDKMNKLSSTVEEMKQYAAASDINKDTKNRLLEYTDSISVYAADIFDKF